MAVREGTVESLGAKFIDVPYETAEEEAARGRGRLRPRPCRRAGWSARRPGGKRVAQADVVIRRPLIPGRAAPTLITEAMVQSMKPGSVIAVIAAGKGPDGGRQLPADRGWQDGGEARRDPGGQTNLPAPVAADARRLYARNVLDFSKLVITKEGTFTGATR